MKKNAFTMAELLLAIGIIGIISAISVPVISGIIPDADKAKVIKYHNNLVKYTTDLLDNNGVYYETGNCVGLECENQPVTAPFNEQNDAQIYGGNAKYENLIKYMMGIDNNNELADGSSWTITRVNSGQYTISVDIDGLDRGNNCSFSDRCPRPDTFVFRINRLGVFTPGDALTDAYLANQTVLNRKKDDMNLARTNLANKQYGDADGENDDEENAPAD